MERRFDRDKGGVVARDRWDEIAGVVAVRVRAPDTGDWASLDFLLLPELSPYQRANARSFAKPATFNI
jgi:hypothetical protein